MGKFVNGVWEMETDPAKVSEYVIWKGSRVRYPLYHFARKLHWRRRYMRRVDHRWFMTPRYWLMEMVMRFTKSSVMRGDLNSYELIRAGIELGQYQYNYRSDWGGQPRVRVSLNG